MYKFLWLIVNKKSFTVSSNYIGGLKNNIESPKNTTKYKITNLALVEKLL